MTLITFIPASGYDTGVSGVINVGGGVSYDVHAGLVAGSGQITVDDTVSPALVRALRDFKGLTTSGAQPNTPQTVDVIGPVLAHSGTNPQPGDTLVRGGDGLYTPQPGSLGGAGSGVGRIDFCGHSIPGAGGSVGGDQNAYPDRLAKAVGAQQRVNLAQGGAVACWPSAAATGDGGWSWVLNMFRPPNSSDGNGGYLPHTNLAIIHFGQNDIPEVGPAAPNPWLQALQTIASRYCASAVFDDNDASWTYGTGMTAITNNNTYNGLGAHYATWGGALNAQQFGQWACPADYPGNEVIALGLTIIGGVVGSGATTTVTVTIDGTPYDFTINHDKGGACDAENGKNNGVVLRFGRSDCGFGASTSVAGITCSGIIPPLAPGAHTIKVALKSASANGLFFIIDYAQIEADPYDGPVCVFPSLYRAASPTNNGYNLWAGWTHGPDKAVDPVNDAGIFAWNALLRAFVAAQFPNRGLFVDIDTSLNKQASLMSPTDYTHPTNRGHSLIARLIYSTLLGSGLLSSRVLNSGQANRFTDAFGGGRWRPIGGWFGTNIGIPFLNSWVNFGGSFSPPAYTKSLQGRVQVRGAVKNGVAGNAIHSLPSAAGYAPTGSRDRVCPTYTGTAFATGVLRADPTNNLFCPSGGLTTGVWMDHEWEAEA